MVHAQSKESLLFSPRLLRQAHNDGEKRILLRPLTRNDSAGDKLLYFIATPIGNLKDISYRAVEMLNSVDEIACEDTRHSLTLLKAYDIKKPLFAYHKFNEKEECERIIEKLKGGKNIAVITDAGLPVISDPGNVLVNALIENGLEYTVIPGANAALSALILSGFNAEHFCFLGFLPEKKSEREEILKEYKTVSATLIFYSAPHDVKKDIETLYVGLGDRCAAAVKEITKIHERVEFFNLKDGLSAEPKGEYVLVVDGAKRNAEYAALSEEEHIDMYLKGGMDKKEALKRVAKERGVPKSSLYKYTIKEK